MIRTLQFQIRRAARPKGVLDQTSFLGAYFDSIWPQSRTPNVWVLIFVLQELLLLISKPRRFPYREETRKGDSIIALLRSDGASTSASSPAGVLGTHP